MTRDERVEQMYTYHKPVMGTPDDTFDGHASAWGQAKLSAIAVILDQEPLEADTLRRVRQVLEYRS